MRALRTEGGVGARARGCGLLLLLVAAVGLLGPQQALADPGEAPDWFLRLPCPDEQVIGYGAGRTFEKAAARARREIAQTLRTRILATGVYEQGEDETGARQSARERVVEETDVVLTGVETVRKELRNGRWFVALKVDNLPLWKKVARACAGGPCRPVQQNRYLARTPLIRSLEARLACPPRFGLDRRHGLWRLTYGEEAAPLSPGEFERLFARCESPFLTLSPSAGDLREGDVFSLRVVPGRPGYLSLLDVCEDGQVFVLTANRQVRADEVVIFPDPDGEQELFAGLPPQSRATYDLYVAVLGSERLDLGRISRADHEIQSGERHHKLPELLPLLDAHPFATVIVRTRAR